MLQGKGILPPLRKRGWRREDPPTMGEGEYPLTIRESKVLIQNASKGKDLGGMEAARGGHEGIETSEEGLNACRCQQKRKQDHEQRLGKVRSCGSRHATKEERGGISRPLKLRYA